MGDWRQIGRDNSDIARDNAREVANVFSHKVSDFGKPYIRRLTLELLAAGLPEEYLEYGFKRVFEDSKDWRVLKKDKYALLAMNRLVIRDLLVPNYNRKASAHEYDANIDKALMETAKWIRGELANDIQKLFGKISFKYAIEAYKESLALDMVEIPLPDWQGYFKKFIMDSPSFFKPGGPRTAEILHAIVNA